MASIREILKRVGRSVGGAEWFMILLPFLEELFAALMERCANTEDQAMDKITDPSPSQMKYMHFRVRLAMRRQKDIPRRERCARAWDVVFAIIDEANEDPKAVCAAFNEVTQRPDAA